MVALLGWIGKMLVELKGDVAVITGQMAHLNGNHDGLKEWVAQIAADVKRLEHETTILKTKQGLP
jgi:hypothetical protein